MHLSNLRIQHKLLVLVGIMIVSTLCIALLAYNYTQQDALQSRKAQIQTMVTAHILPINRIADARPNIANSSLENALSQYIYDASLSEDYYLFMMSGDGFVVANGLLKSIEGKHLSDLFDPEIATDLISQMENALSNGGFYWSYTLNRPGSDNRINKTAYVTPIEGTPYFLGASAYLDNLVPFYKTSGALLIVLSLLSLTAIGLMSYFISGNITRPVNRLSSQMRELAEGNLETEFEGINRGDEVGDISRAMTSVKDKILENQRLRTIHEKVEFLETFDPVTRLLNREAFGEAINREISRNDNHGLSIAVFKFDLLHEIGIELGNDERDRVLLNLASRMHDNLLADEQLSRLSEDTFSLLLPASSDENEITAKCRALLKVIAYPITLSTTPIQITARAGVSIYPRDGSYDAQLIGRAESTVTLAKRLERDVLFYDGTSLTETEQGVELWQEMQKALDGDDFYLVFQPLFALEDNELVAAEVLLRWEHPEKGFISPAHFIPVAEQSGLISRLDAWVLEAVAKQLATWSEQQMALPRIAVNLSGISFLRPDFERTLRDIFDRHHVPLSLLELELTEGVLIDDLDLISEQLKKIRATGAQISIDDFGTGYSSLSRIKNLAIDTVKVDRSFIDGIDTSPQDRKIVEAIILMAHGLNLHVVAEGIETPEQLTVLRELGSDIAQGFFLSRPLKSEPFEELLEQDLVIETE